MAEIGRVQTGPPGSDQTLGELVAAATKDFTSLIRKEVELAKTEVKGELKTVSKGAVGLGIAAGAGLFGGLFISVAAVFLISIWIPMGWAFFVIAMAYLMVAGMGAMVGLMAMKRIEAPPRTIRTVKDTAEWARHPTVAPDMRVDTLYNS